MGLVCIPTWLIFLVFHVLIGKYTSPMDPVGYVVHFQDSKISICHAAMLLLFVGIQDK